MFHPLASRVATFYAPGMFRAPRKLDSEPELYETAVRALMRRAHSIHEMKKSLERRTDDKSLVKSVLDRLKHQGMIDDARYAKQFTRQRAEIRKQGKFRIARELRARGIPDQHIDSALEESAKETDERAVVRQRIEKKLKLFRGEIDDRKIASLFRSLLRAGFSSDVVGNELRAATREDVPAIENAVDEELA
ncbi:MAG TPA: regulatory protein RecX [Methylomirabilota bacterium]|jgi:regulatory protein|nr:regulatory protein RecX [Methylomirabilota bacterium]